MSVRGYKAMNPDHMIDLTKSREPFPLCHKLLDALLAVECEINLTGMCDGLPAVTTYDLALPALETALAAFIKEMEMRNNVLEYEVADGEVDA